MSAHIRTDYAQSDQHFASRASVIAYAALGVLLVAAPFLIESYYLSQLVFVLIY
ncbi:MAG: inner-rane translocator, partial [Tardiphaga sp.]|nr:inner-rane translocator [Tardiphaga sp.]